MDKCPELDSPTSEAQGLAPTWSTNTLLATWLRRKKETKKQRKEGRKGRKEGKKGRKEGRKNERKEGRRERRRKRKESY